MLAIGSNAWFPIELLPAGVTIGSECHMQSSVPTQNSPGDRPHYPCYRVRVTAFNNDAAYCEVIAVEKPQAATVGQ